jgi:hypothetical protein
MTTLLTKLVIDITALPGPEQASIMYFRRSEYTLVYQNYLIVSLIRPKEPGSSRQRRQPQRRLRVVTEP